MMGLKLIFSQNLNELNIGYLLTNLKQIFEDFGTDQQVLFYFYSDLPNLRMIHK